MRVRRARLCHRVSEQGRIGHVTNRIRPLRDGAYRGKSAAEFARRPGWRERRCRARARCCLRHPHRGCARREPRRPPRPSHLRGGRRSRTRPQTRRWLVGPWRQPISSFVRSEAGSRSRRSASIAWRSMPTASRPVYPMPPIGAGARSCVSRCDHGRSSRCYASPPPAASRTDVSRSLGVDPCNA